jgi:hypothetical protein
MILPGGKSTSALLAACSAVAIFAASGSAMAAPPPNCPTQKGTGPGFIPVQTIKIFNDSVAQQIYVELEVGKPNPDLWIQDICNVPDAQKDKLYPYPTTLTNRFYINGLTGIPPGGSVTITLPLYTQLAATVVPTSNDQYAEWWQGQNMQIFAHPVGSGAPKALQNYFNGKAPTRPPGSQKPMVFNSSNPTKPTCTAGGTLNSCSLSFFTDTAGTLPKFAPSQLVEATLGANQGKVPAATDGSITSFLYPTQADFDVSYVNVADLAAAMGPVGNDQAGYVGSPMKPGVFKPLLNTFQPLNTWPTFIDLDGTKAAIPKLPSPLELMARLSGAAAPADLTPLGPSQKWPTNVWQPIQTLRTNWNKYSTAQNCQHSAEGDTTFCDAVLDVRDIIHANYLQYQQLMAAGTCTGGAVSETADRTIAHVYGWQPWTEAASGKEGEGCGPKANLLENTPGYGSEDKTYAKYAMVKTEFDNLNYGGPSGVAWKPAAPYVFNPWVTFIHGTPPGKEDKAKGYLGMPGVYAYSVDDAVGNLNVYATGYIVDIGSTEHLENTNPAGPPIDISLGYAFTDKVKFVAQSACGPNKNIPVNPANPVLTISAINPQNCPVWLTDNKGTNYTFTIKPTVAKPPLFTDIPTSDVRKNPSQASWSTGKGYPGSGNNPTPYNTTSIIDCSGNTSDLARKWCCTRLANLNGEGFGSGVFAYSTPLFPPTGHQAYDNHVVTNPATGQDPVGIKFCNMGKP